MYNWVLNFSFLWVCFFAIPILAAGQKLEKAEMSIDLRQADISVDIAYQLISEETFEAITLKGIGTDWPQMSDIQVQIQGKAYDLKVEGTEQLVQDLVVQLDTPTQINGSEQLRVAYQITKSAGKNQVGTYTIPVLYVDGEAAETSKDAFQVSLLTSEGQTVQSIFPAMQWKKNAKGDQYSFNMQVLPAWIKFKLYPGPAPFLTLERKVDFGVLFVLIGLLLFGGQRLKQHKA